MSSASSAAEVSDKDDILWNLVKNNEFLQYEQSVEQIRPSRFDFPVVTGHDDGVSFSKFGIEVIQDYLHIGLINEDSANGKVKRQRVLLCVWPNFVPPEAYHNYKLHLVDIKKIKTLVFRVPDSVFRKYSEGNCKLHEIVAATAILTPVDDWKLLERTVISSFYHLTFDKATSDLHGDTQVWKDYPKDNLNKEWKQLFFICCGPQGLAYLVKRMLKRNWARIARNSISIETESDGYSVFCTGGVVLLIVEWAKQFFKPDGVVKFVEELNSVKPVLNPSEIADKANSTFSQYMSFSKRHRCKECSYETDKKTNYDNHMRTHTEESPYVCDICGSAHKQPSLLKSHKIIHHTGNYRFRCKYCGRPFITGGPMKYHVSLHEKKGNVNFQCYRCNFTAKDETGLMQHIPTHVNDATFDCSVCHKKHDSETALLLHLRNHSKDKPFKCHICAKGFLTEQHLRAHYDTHSDSRTTYKCHVCKKNLSTISSLRTHMANKHGEE